ncbi:MAG: HEAT repeat domain-containing protein [Gloeotrichia echinulata DVL01]|jgi:predicted NACHT family NTPase|nr:HEAT repeat domain-containing protein [Gloeotrichia echinulata DEX184]
MFIDWLAAWGVGTGVGFCFQPVMARFAQNLSKNTSNYALDLALIEILGGFTQEEKNIFAGKAFTAFLKLVQKDLEDGGLSKSDIEQYNQPFKKFLDDETVTKILLSTFKQDCEVINIKKLAAIWYQLNSSSSLPDDFNWKRVVKQYVKKVKEEIILDSPELVAILENQTFDNIKLYTQEIACIVADLNLQKYQLSLREQYENVKLYSLDAQSYTDKELKLSQIFIPQNVREIFQVVPQVYEQPKEHFRRLIESNQKVAEIAEELEGYKRIYVEQQIHSVLDIINKSQIYQYIVFLGNPGAGKSTLLQYLALNWAESPLENLIYYPLPLLIELGIYMQWQEDNQSDNFFEFLHKSSGVFHYLNQHEFHKQLQLGKTLVMFDGLDEVFNCGKREQVINDIHNFKIEYPNARIILTSRVIGYKPQALRDADFHHFMVQEFDAEQIQRFIYRWHELTFNFQEDKTAKKEYMQTAIFTSKAIAELAGNPLLLTIMLMLNRHHELPRTRPELYNQASRLLIHLWDVEPTLVESLRLESKTFDYQDKQAILRRVAYWMQTSNKGLAGNLISADDLENILADYLIKIFDNPKQVAKLMINQLRHSNLILCYCGSEYYGFIHRNFWEYFCASELVYQFKEQQSLSFAQLQTEIYGNYWHHEKWHEILQFIIAMIEPKLAGDIIESLMNQKGEGKKFINLFLAAKCLAEVKNRFLIASTANKLLNLLTGLTKYDLPYYYGPFWDYQERNLVREIRTQAITAVATIWTEQPDNLYILEEYATSDKNEYVRIAAVEELACEFQNDPETFRILKNRAISDANEYVRTAAVEELARGFKDNPETLFFLKERATDDENEYVRIAAVEQLAHCFKDDTDTLFFLKQRATSDNSGNVRYAIVQELARGFKDDANIVNFLQECATNDDDRDVRKAAVQELARGFKDNSKTLHSLKRCAISDSHESVRKVAMQELARGFQDDTDTLDFLKECAISDHSMNVRTAVVQELARWFKYDTLAFLKERAICDNSGNVRTAAVQELARGFKDDAETLSFLKERAISDNSGNVRTAVLQELARSFKEESETLSFLKERAISDNSGNVRTAVLQELARGFQDDPDTLGFLKERAIFDDNEYVRTIAVQELARGFQDDPDTLGFLKQCATTDDNEYVRTSAVQELARGFQDDSDTLPILKERATVDNSGNVRKAAVQELAWVFKEDANTLSILQECAISDDNQYVRKAAVQELARGFKDDPQTLTILKKCATIDDSGNVRTAVVQELAWGFKDDPDILTILKKCATADDDRDVRKTALQELAWGFQNDPDTLTILKERATVDDNEYVRKVAVQKLARGFQDHPNTVSFLKQRATGDNHEYVRYAALEELARNFKDDPDTVSFLKERATADDNEYVRKALMEELVRGVSSSS